MRARCIVIVSGFGAALIATSGSACAQSNSAAASPQGTAEWIGSIKCQKATAPLETVPEAEYKVRGLQESGKISIEQIGGSGWRKFFIDIDSTGRASSNGSGSWEGKTFNSFFGGQFGEIEITLQGSRHFSGPSAGIGNATFSQRCILTLARSGIPGQTASKTSGSATGSATSARKEAQVAAESERATREPGAKRADGEPAQVAVASAAPPRIAIPAAEKRIALVIGNGLYDEGRLPNPQNDARLMDSVLKAVGFDVTTQLDADYQTMRRATQAFGAKLAGAGTEAVGLFFYAGHGIQAGGRNYLIPVKAKLAREADLEIEAVNAGVLLTQMEHAQSRLNLVILDACRNNPFTRGFRSAGRGLARMDAPRGTLIAYSTAPDDVAADGTGANSPYAAALADAIRQPGVPVERTFKDVRAKVLKSTGNHQVPWEASSLVGEFAFLPAVSAAPGAATPVPAGADIEVVFWQSIQASTDRSDFEEYLRQFPNGRFAGIARNRVRSLR